MKRVEADFYIEGPWKSSDPNIDVLTSLKYIKYVYGVIDSIAVCIVPCTISHFEWKKNKTLTNKKELLRVKVRMAIRAVDSFIKEADEGNRTD